MEYLAICLTSAIWAGIIARHKGSSVWIWATVGAVLPFLGVLAAALFRYERDEPKRACPGCGKVVPISDALCMRCGTELEFPGLGAEPRSGASTG